MVAYRARRATREDSKRIWEIRNHPDVRKISGNPEAFPFDRHDSWFEEKYFARKGDHCFVLQANDENVVGYCRIDQAKGNYLVSIALDPSLQGKGLGSMLLRESISESFGPSVKNGVLAYVKRNNPDSYRFFVKNGFCLIEEDDECFLLRYSSVRE